MKEIKQTAIIGMGALGLLYGNRIASSIGNDRVHYVADEERARKYKDIKHTVNGVPKCFHVEDSRYTKPADLVIVAVKYNALLGALDTMKNCVNADTIIISVMNGISSEKIIGQRFGAKKVLYAVAQGMDAMKFDERFQYTNFGELRIGIRMPEQKDKLDALTDFLSWVRIPYTVDEDILQNLWGKFMLNVGINQTCMAFETTYAGALASGEVYETMIGAMKEVMALAQLEQVNLTESDLDNYVSILKTLSPDAVPSMRQDGILHRPSEVEMFSGTVLSMAEKHGLPVPVNRMLYDRIKQMEANY